VLRILLSNTHEGEDAGEAEKGCWNPGRKERREQSRFSEKEENVEEDPVAESDHHADPDTQGDPAGAARPQGKRDSDQHHDQIQERVGEF